MVFIQMFAHKVCCNGGNKSIKTFVENYAVQQRYLRTFNTSSRKSRGKWPGTKQKQFEPVKNPYNSLAIETEQTDITRLFKPFVFTVAFSSASFTCAAIWQYENVRERAMSSIYKGMPWIHGRVKHVKHGEWRNYINNYWNSLTEGQRMFIPICFANVLVFLAWRVPAFQNSLVKFFCSNPASKVICWPMVLSTFSHYSTLHLFANMYVLHSFSTGAVLSMGKEQFLGFYLAAGVISSFASYLHKVIVNRPGLSLGASGAIMAVLAYTCTKYPDLELSIIFFPFFSFKAGAAIKAIMGIDAAGVLLGWKIFDHAAHLGGALFGMFWAYWGHQYIWSKKDPMLEVWHNIRSPSR